MQTLTTAMTTLTHVVTQQQNQRQVRDVTIVEKPQAFKGDTSEAARLFRYAFRVWARGNMRAFALRNPDGTYQLDAAGDKVPDEGAMIASALSFMQGTAGQWSRPHLETIADNGVAFQNSWTRFEEAFKSKFEPVDAEAEAKSQLTQLKQGSRDFSSYLAEFEMWSPHTGWSQQDLFDRLKAGLSTDYIERLAYFVPLPRDYATLVTCCKNIDIAKVDLRSNLAAASGRAPLHHPHPQSAFRDPNAMDIDASNLDDAFQGLTSREEVIKRHRQEMRNRCRVCGSKNHRADDPRHSGTTTCNWCGKSGHWERVCIQRLSGVPKAQPGQAVRANTAGTPQTSTPANPTTSRAPTAPPRPPPAAAVAASIDPGAEFARMQDMLAMQQKQLNEMTTLMSQHFRE